MTDARGPIVRELRSPQTLLRSAQVAALVDEYRQGVPVRELADRYNVHRTTVSEHIAAGPARRRDGDESQTRDSAAPLLGDACWY